MTHAIRRYWEWLWAPSRDPVSMWHSFAVGVAFGAVIVWWLT